ncbi:MAG: helix-turn-helix transcriptional regulator [Phycisphaerae bacterium]|nr:helix-turn-helix transcriptional regulator [Phycisphaerae bacterium]
MDNILEFTKQAILDSGISRYRIAQDTGIDQASLSLFVNDKRGIGADRAQAILEYLGYEIKIIKIKSSKGYK